MKKPCTPRLVLIVHQKKRSWRKAAQELNDHYGMNLSHLTWRDYATGRRDIADPEIRSKLLLGLRSCPACGARPSLGFTHLLKRMDPRDLKHWNQLRKEKKYHAASRFLEEIYNR